MTTLGDLFYGYDQAGRRTAAWGSFARTGLPAATTQAASYNANNRLTSWNGTSLTYDPNGNLTSFGPQTYAWNDRNQLASTSGGSASFAYDGLGRRLSKIVGGATTKYLYDGANVVQEQGSANAATANLLTGLGIDQVFTRQVVGGATSSLLTDALGSTIALGDASGSVQTSYTYESFGGVTASGATNTNSYQFTGRENDGSSGLYFYRARYYNPTFGRFVSEDPLGYPGGPDPDIYAYVFDNPTQLFDPFGLDPGNGCGFLGLGCILRPFQILAASTFGWLYGLANVGSQEGGFSFGTSTLSVCLIVCGGIGISSAGIDFFGGFFGLRGIALTWSPGIPSTNVYTSFGGCAYAICLGASRDQTTREWSPIIGVTFPPIGGWAGNFGYIRLISF